uniref:Uncharacterized protein n=1 Tax=Kalanchoe fedtschenkoi TaxID=63787 RepID=A0A7N0VK65_KALFE
MLHEDSFSDYQNRECSEGLGSRRCEGKKWRQNADGDGALKSPLRVSRREPRTSQPTNLGLIGSTRNR